MPGYYLLAINTIINHHKKRKFSEVSLEGGWEQKGKYVQDFSLEDRLASQYDTEDNALFDDMQNIIDRLISELPEQYRMALSLRYQEEMSYEDIARALDQPLGTVKSNVYRARNLLRKRMQSCGLLEV